MKATLITTVLAAAAAALLSFSAEAADAYSTYIRESAPPPFADAGPGKTRAQVRAELAEAVARGEVSNGGVAPLARPYNFTESAPAPFPTQSAKTRAQVKAELAEAIAQRELFLSGGNQYRRGYESAPYVEVPQAVVKR